MPAQPPGFFTKLVKYVNVIGWISGFLTSAIMPSLTKPLGSSFDFYLGGVMSGILGFVTLYRITPTLGATVRFFVSAALIVLSLVSINAYRFMLYAPENATPSMGTEIYELILFWRVLRGDINLYRIDSSW